MYECKEIKICVHLQSYNYDCHLVEQNNYIYERVQILILQNNEKNQYVRLDKDIYIYRKSDDRFFCETMMMIDDNDFND